MNTFRAQESPETAGPHESRNQEGGQRWSVSSELDSDAGYDRDRCREAQLAEVKPVEEEGQHADARNREKREGPGAYDAVLRLRSRRARRFGCHDCRHLTAMIGELTRSSTEDPLSEELGCSELGSDRMRHHYAAPG